MFCKRCSVPLNGVHFNTKYCVLCKNVVVKENHVRGAVAWQKRNPNKVHDAHLKRKFRITMAQYNALKAIQNNVCAICALSSTKNLAVDHDHGTGSIRGLLCLNCNIGIGQLGDTLQNLINAKKYLEAP